jgi:hypothetical protein
MEIYMLGIALVSRIDGYEDLYGNNFNIFNLQYYRKLCELRHKSGIETLINTIIPVINTQIRKIRV